MNMSGGINLMRELTFKGFLTQYVKQLSRSDSLDMKRLTAEAVSENPRLQAPLVLYAVATGTSALLRKYLPSSDKAEGMMHHLSVLSHDHLEAQLQDLDLAEEYRKAWNSFLVARNASLHDYVLKSTMREKIIQLQKANSCTNYRIYSDLKLNPGNINSWLRNGDSRKVSYQTARMIMEYVLNFQSGNGRKSLKVPNGTI